MRKVKNLQVWMPMDWKLSNEVWHFCIWPLVLFNSAFVGRKNGIPILVTNRSDFSQKYDFSFQFFSPSLIKLRRTTKRPTVLNRFPPLLTIPFTLRKIYFFTNFRIFYKGVHRLLLRKIRKVKNFQVCMPMDWKLSNELNEVWHSTIWRLVFL